jgi:hypothetical protein
MPFREKLKIKVDGSKKRRPKDAQKLYEKDVKSARHRLLSHIEEFHAQAQHFLDVASDNEQNILMRDEKGEDEEEGDKDVFEKGEDEEEGDKDVFEKGEEEDEDEDEDVFEVDEFEKGEEEEEDEEEGDKDVFEKGEEEDEDEDEDVFEVDEFEKGEEEDEDVFEVDEFDWDGSDVESEEESDEEDDAEQFDDGVQPEHIPLQLPSTQGRDACVASQRTGLMEQEIELRTGQANDALSQIRLGLNYKAYLWKEYKQTDNYKMKTRSSTALRAAEHNIQQHVAAYSLAFRALTSLDQQGLFKPIKKEDLYLNPNIVKQNRIGQSKVALSWIWRTGQLSKDESEDTWRQKSKHCSFHHIVELTQPTS